MTRHLCLLLLLLAGSRAAAQSAPQCVTVPDSVRGSTPGQLAERRVLRERLVAVGRRHGVNAPQGLLLVDVDSTRRGRLLFLESNFPEPAVEQATRAVAEYLEALPAGRPYQALIRVDGEYPDISGGRKHCPPVMESQVERARMTFEAQERHPLAGRVSRPIRSQALLLLVVTREGTVALPVIARSSGDEYLDQAALEIGRRMRFTPPSVDGEPFDMRLRLPINFVVQ